jgi:hypothetical protein
MVSISQNRNIRFENLTPQIVDYQCIKILFTEHYFFNNQKEAFIINLA